ncbi:hypothetical protein [Hahella ganghwensis]|uniref:hypothetical protein n=1 Tax=Hahella ganghwensis TaxID=286420 RepID=UPI0012F7E150|nr:hypothetical protein [Hahella ganghwensis]
MQQITIAAAAQQLDIQGLLTRDGLLNPAFFNIAQSDLLRILDRLTQGPLNKALRRQRKKRGPSTATDLLRNLMRGIGQMGAQNRSLLFNQAAVEMTTDQLEKLYLAAPEEHLSLELIESVTVYGQRLKQEQLHMSIQTYKDYQGQHHSTDQAALALLQKSLGISHSPASSVG